MKEYPLTKGELVGLGGMSFGATISFSVSSFLLSTWFDLRKDLALTKDISPATQGYWSGLADGAFWGGWVAVAVGLAFLLANGLTLFSIINDTRHK